MEAEHPADFSHLSPVEIIRRQDGARLGIQSTQRLRNGCFDTGVDRCHRHWISGGELRTFFFLLFETDQPLLRPIAVYELLRNNGAQPSFERSTTHIGSKLRNASAVPLVHSIKVGIEGIG